MKWIYNKVFILNHQVLFFTFLILIVLMIILAFVFAKKELKKQDDIK